METTTDSLRIHAGTEPGPNPNGEFVLYWMQGVAMRTTGNPALTFAIEQANLMGVPVLLYQGLRPDYPWASDRIHTFILQAAVDLYQGFARRGIQYAFYLDGGDHSSGPSPLVSLARRAKLVVTEFFPTFIQPRQLRGLRERVETPVVAVDASTLVPLRYLDLEYATARAIRPVLHRALPHYLVPISTPEPSHRRRIELPFDEHLNGSSTSGDLAALIATLDIDHAVAPSPTVVGGERAAWDRLDRFVTKGLPRYLERNDPNLDVTSRLSPHLHFGTIGIADVLLRAQQAGPADQFAKFLDEALVWRELAFNTVYFNRRHRSLGAVPEWARRELEAHSDDPRASRYDLATLESGRTHEELWNAAQQSLVKYGELHNYVRMLWGKSVLLWTASAAEALRLLEHLNHRYALDGRDPCSYGGILWCFGRYDRPFYRRPILGTVRYMSLKAARDKFDVPAYIRGI
ncbi:MAG: deoxyribodipyrimidine photolyase [Gemmatimonadetes bacterium]|nr:deoxyribodipyrimidine photolyase [Gemmatimonadota bacterium]